MLFHSPQLCSLNFNSHRKGFTLLEILLVVAAIGILASIVLVAINPGYQLAQTRDAQRKVDVNTILNAVYQYAIDNDGDLPGAITSTATVICQTDVSDTSCTDTDLIDLSGLTDSELYLVQMPTDPQCSTTDSTCYTIETTANDRVIVAAPDAENTTISVTR